VPGTHPCANVIFQGAPSQGGTIAGTNRSLKANNNHEIAPRIGIAWDPKGDGKMAIRGGFGQFWQRERISNYLYLGTNSPFSLGIAGQRTLSGSALAADLSSSGGPSWGLDPSTKEPYTYQYNLTFEREIARGSKMEIAYVGNHGNNVLQYRDANAVLPANRVDFALNNNNLDRFAASPLCGHGNPQPGCFGTINYGSWTARSNYNSLQALVRSHFKALDAQFAYTWSKSLASTDITNSGNLSSTATITDTSNPNLDYGPTPIDRRHVFVSNSRTTSLI